MKPLTAQQCATLGLTLEDWTPSVRDAGTLGFEAWARKWCPTANVVDAMDGYKAAQLTCYLVQRTN